MAGITASLQIALGVILCLVQQTYCQDNGDDGKPSYKPVGTTTVTMQLYNQTTIPPGAIKCTKKVNSEHRDFFCFEGKLCCWQKCCTEFEHWGQENMLYWMPPLLLVVLLSILFPYFRRWRANKLMKEQMRNNTASVPSYAGGAQNYEAQPLQSYPNHPGVPQPQQPPVNVYIDNPPPSGIPSANYPRQTYGSNVPQPGGSCDGGVTPGWVAGGPPAAPPSYYDAAHYGGQQPGETPAKV